MKLSHIIIHISKCRKLCIYYRNIMYCTRKRIKKDDGIHKEDIRIQVNKAKRIETMISKSTQNALCHFSFRLSSTPQHYVVFPSLRYSIASRFLFFCFSVFSLVFCVLYSFISLSVFASFHTLLVSSLCSFQIFFEFLSYFFLHLFFFICHSCSSFRTFFCFYFFFISVTYSRCSIIVCRVAIVVISENFSYYSNNSY